MGGQKAIETSCKKNFMCLHKKKTEKGSSEVERRLELLLPCLLTVIMNADEALELFFALDDDGVGSVGSVSSFELSNSGASDREVNSDEEKNPP